LIACIMVLPFLVTSLIAQILLERVGREILGNKYRNLLKLNVSNFSLLGPRFFVDLLSELIFGKLLGWVQIIGAVRLNTLLKYDRERLVYEVYIRLFMKSERVPKGAWEEFYKRNPEAKKLKKI